MPVLTRRLSRVETVAEHLKRRGHISEGSALVEYGRFRLADVIHRLRNERRDLLPEGMEIVTIHKQDTQGNTYGEYTLVSTKAAKVRRMVEEARERERIAQKQGELSEHDYFSLSPRLGAVGGVRS